jgi:hypothetical protein
MFFEKCLPLSMKTFNLKLDYFAFGFCQKKSDETAKLDLRQSSNQVSANLAMHCNEPIRNRDHEGVAIEMGHGNGCLSNQSPNSHTTVIGLNWQHVQ